MPHGVTDAVGPRPRAPFQPYVPASQSPAEFTIKAIVLGVLFGLLFGASTVYLGLRAGLTVSASIPIAVLAISVLKRLGGSTILENNIVQTIGSAGESVAGGVVFTMPALIFLMPYGPRYFNYLQITLLTLRRRHPRRADDGAAAPGADRQGARRAAVPEGTACAEVLVAGERGGTLATTGVRGPRHRRALEGAVVDLQPVPHRDRLLDAADQPVPERDAQRRHLARVPRRRLCDRSAHRRRRCSRAACCRGWCCCRCCRFSGNFITVPFPPIHPNFANNPATGLPVPHLGDEARAALERVHPLHRRRRRAGRRPHHAGAHHPDDRLVGARSLKDLRRGAAARRRSGRSATSR